MSDVRADIDQTAEWTADRIASLKCVVREDGKRSHIFLDHSNKCECGQIDLNVYRQMELR